MREQSRHVETPAEGVEINRTNKQINTDTPHVPSSSLPVSNQKQTLGKSLVRYHNVGLTCYLQTQCIIILSPNYYHAKSNTESVCFRQWITHFFIQKKK